MKTRSFVGFSIASLGYIAAISRWLTSGVFKVVDVRTAETKSAGQSTVIVHPRFSYHAQLRHLRMSSNLMDGLAHVWVLVPITMGMLCSTVVAGADDKLPADFIDRLVTDGQTIRLTLPNGQQVVGKIESIQRAGQGIQRVSGTVQHPEAGSFSFERPESGKLQGTLAFDSKPTEWKIEPVPDGGGFRLVEAPVADAFRPRKMQIPTAAMIQPKPGLSREDAEATLRKDLKIEKISDDKLRIGQVELDKPSRTIRFPAVVNMHGGTIEYAVVAHTGKCHESLFSTTASPRDVHLAMLLLGVKPAQCAENPDKGLLVPADAAITVKAEWQNEGGTHSHPLNELLTIEQSASAMRDAKAKSSFWLYNGSKFNEAGFTALVEGSIISLIADDTALINNPGKDRGDDAIHLPNSDLLPATGTQVTLILSPHRP